MATFAEASVDGYHQPSDEERQYYYYGLPGGPHLVARTSTTAWPSSTFVLERAARKKLSIVGPDHDLAHKWCIALRTDLIGALEDSGLGWDAFYPIRIGQEDDRLNPNSHAVVLLILLRPDAEHAWPVAMRLALRCRSLLCSYGILSVETEIMRSRYVPMASSAAAALAAKVDWTFSQDVRGLLHRDMSMASINEEILPLLPFAGHRIEQEPTPEDSEAAVGTLGVFVRLGQRLSAEERPQAPAPASAIFGLTSRHVAVGKRVPTDQDVRHGDDKEALRVLSGGLASIADSSVGLVKATAVLRHAFRETETNFREDPDNASNTALYNMQKRCLAYAGDLKDELARLAEQADTARRTIGTVAYSPKHAVAQHGSLRDWALISMQDNALVDDGQLNRVYMVSDTTQGAMKKAIGMDGVEVAQRFSSAVVGPDASGFLQLHGCNLPSHPPFVLDRKAHLVAKRGQASGLTFGLTNNIEAVRRNPFYTKQQQQQQDTPQQIVSLHLLVLGFQAGSFAKAGDSGSCVFDCHGRVVGLVDGGIRPGDADDSAGLARDKGGNNAMSPDVTFVTPIQSILDDIRDFTGREVHIV